MAVSHDDIPGLLRKHGYTPIREVGHGGFGKALKVQSVGGEGFTILCKLVDVSTASPEEKNTAVNEGVLLASFRHPYIVGYRESFLESGWLGIFMEYCEGGDLKGEINSAKKKRTPIPEDKVLRWVTQAIFALSYIHNKGILHRDLKPANFFLSKAGFLKMGDFGIAKVLSCTASFAITCCGTYYYMSPEVCQGKQYERPADMWAMGCIIYELCERKVPFDPTNIVELVEKIRSGPTPLIGHGYSDLCRNLSSNMLDKAPARRPSALEILQLPRILEVVTELLDAGRAAIEAQAASAAQGVVAAQAPAPVAPAAGAAAEGVLGAAAASAMAALAAPVDPAASAAAAALAAPVAPAAGAAATADAMAALAAPVAPAAGAAAAADAMVPMADGGSRPFTRCSRCQVEVPFENLTLHEVRCGGVRAPESTDQASRRLASDLRPPRSPSSSAQRSSSVSSMSALARQPPPASSTGRAPSVRRLSTVLAPTVGQQRDGAVVGGGGPRAEALANFRRGVAELEQVTRSLGGNPQGVGVGTRRALSSSASSSSLPGRAETSAFQVPQPPAPGQVQDARQQLQELQQRILDEVQRRRDLAARRLVAAEGAVIATASVPGQNSAEETALQASLADFVRRLPTQVVTATEHDRSWVRETCAVCMESFEPGETVKTLPCFHLFHQACVDEWLVTRGTCPTCGHSLGAAEPG